MASIEDFPERNLILTAPPGAEAEVGDLPVRRSEDGTIVSCWRLDPDELAEVNRTGGIVWLSVWGGMTHPPVLVAGLKAWVIPIDQQAPSNESLKPFFPADDPADLRRRVDAAQREGEPAKGDPE